MAIIITKWESCGKTRCGKTTRLWLIHSLLSSCLSWWVPSVRDKLNCNVVLSRKRNNQRLQSRWVSRMWPPGRTSYSGDRKDLCYQDLAFLAPATVLRIHFLVRQIPMSLSFSSPASMLGPPFPTPLHHTMGKGEVLILSSPSKALLYY